MKLSERAAHQVGWAQRAIKGYPLITAIMFLCLEHLQAVKDDPGMGDCDVLNAHQATINALLDRDWIAEAGANGHALYRITTRGSRYLSFFQSPVEPRRADGICPTCGERPVHAWASGKRAGYCLECSRANAKANRALGRPTINPDRLCSRCGERPLHVHSTGRLRTYCTDCLRETRREERQRKHARKLARIAAGDPPLCPKCGEAVYHTASTVYDLCYRHYLEYQRAYRRRRAYAAWRTPLNQESGEAAR